MSLITDASGFQIGLALGAASLASVGPTTLMLIREGLAHGRKLLVASTAWSVQTSLITASFLCADLIGGADSQAKTAVLWLGVLFLCWFAMRSFRTPAKPGRLDFRAQADEGRGDCLARALGVICTNPLTYIERFLVPASIGQSLDGDGTRLLFATGLILMAGLGCYGYALGGHAMRRILRQHASLAMFDRVSGMIIAGVALSLGAGLIGDLF